MGLFGLVGEGVGAIGDDPALGPEIAGGSGGELVRLDLANRRADTVLIELSRLALNGDVAAVAASHADRVDANIHVGGLGEVCFALGPGGPGMAFGEVPLADLWAGEDGGAFEPLAVGLLTRNLVCGLEGLADDVLHGGVLDRDRA